MLGRFYVSRCLKPYDRHVRPSVQANPKVCGQVGQQTSFDPSYLFHSASRIHVGVLHRVEGYSICNSPKWTKQWRTLTTSKPITQNFSTTSTLYYFDRKKSVVLVTCLMVFQAILFTAAAEFLWNYNFDVVNGEYVPAPLWKKLATSGIFVFTGIFLILTRWVYERRLVHQIDCFNDDKLVLWFYDVFCKCKAMKIQRSEIMPGTFLDAGNYYKFKLRDRKLWFLVDKRGKIENLELFKNIMDRRK